MNKYSVRFADEADHNNILRLRKEIYAGNPNYRDNQTRTVRALLKNKMAIQKSSEIFPVVVEKNHKIVGTAFLAVIDRMNDLFQIAFLEMEEDPQIFDALLSFAKEEAKKRGLKKILVGLNLNVLYGLGLLASDYDKTLRIGGAYNPPYYIDFIEPHATRVKALTSYCTSIDRIQMNSLPPRLLKRLSSFEIRPMNFNNIAESVEAYTEITNRAFEHHDYCYEARQDENLELFLDFKPFLKPENLLFAYKDGKPVAFVLWYPDFNELLGAGEELGLSSLIRYKLFRKKIDTIKLTEIGVVPEYQKKGAIYALFKYLFELNKNRYKYLESGWIMKSNQDSMRVTEKFTEHESKQYKVFEIDVEEG